MFKGKPALEEEERRLGRLLPLANSSCSVAPDQFFLSSCLLSTNFH